MTFKKRIRIRRGPVAQETVNITVSTEQRKEKIKFVFRKSRAKFRRHVLKKNIFPIIKNDKAGGKTRRKEKKTDLIS
ncbi:MAG: hypothetical protein II940_04045 [Methanosarcinaceae archaeon]|nr:hypothetical protein [Methanosarcinaceae archaeon]